MPKSLGIFDKMDNVERSKEAAAKAKQTLSIEDLRQQCIHSHSCYRESFLEAYDMYEYYHGRHLTREQINELTRYRIPTIHVNKIRKLVKQISGYFESIVNTVKVLPQQANDVTRAAVLNEVVNAQFRSNKFDTSVGRDTITDAVITGLIVLFRSPVNTGKTDQFGRIKYVTEIKPVSIFDIFLDPNSREVDYSDAQYVHRSMWLNHLEMKKLFPKFDLSTLSVGTASVESTNIYNLARRPSDNAYCGVSNRYNVIHSIAVEDIDENGQEKIVSVYWCNGVEIERKDVSYRNVRFPYFIYKLHQETTRNEFYGLLRSARGLQQLINQNYVAMLRGTNTRKVYVEPGATKNKQQFAKELGTPGVSIVNVTDVRKIKEAENRAKFSEHMALIEKASRDMEDDLGLTPAFFGVSYAGDSGRKFEMQRHSSITALKVVEQRIKQMYRDLARDLCHFIQQYYRAEQVFDIANEDDITQWMTINKPILLPREDGQGNLILDDEGNPIMDPRWKPAIDPENNEFLKDDKGNQIYIPITVLGSDIQFFDTDIKVDTTIFDNEREVSIQLAEQLLNSPAGQSMFQISPASYFALMAKLVKGYRSTYTDDVAAEFEKVARQLMEQGGATGLPEPGQGGGVQNARNPE